MRGADALIAALERAGVDTVFGMPGGANLPLYDALLDSPIRHVLMRHEAAAGHAAEGYARATGRVGVAFATSGPGATNLVTPICDAHMDSVPTLFVTGQVRTALRGSNAFQEADVLGITAPIVKHSLSVERADDIAQAVTDALHLAIAGRPGPVLLDVPVDVASAPARDVAPHAPQLPGYRPRTKPNGRQIRIAAAAIAAARRPVLYAGGGVVHAGAAGELTALARLTGMPVTTTLMALGTFPASDRQWLGMLGMHGTCAANWAMDEADLIVAVGARFDDRVTGDLAEFAPRAKIVHIDVDPAEIGKNVPVARADRRRRPPRARRHRGRVRRRTGAARGAGGSASTAGAPTRLPARPTPRRRSTRCRRSSAAKRSSPPTSASTRCGRPTGCGSTARAAGSPPAASARWASACRRRSAPRSRVRTRPSSASPARARCSSTCRSSRPSRTNGCPSRSSCSTTAASAWSASSRTCSGTAGAARSTSGDARLARARRLVRDPGPRGHRRRPRRAGPGGHSRRHRSG